MITRTTSSIVSTAVFAIAFASVGASLLPVRAAHAQANPETEKPAAAEKAAPAAAPKPAPPVLRPGPETCERFVAVLGGRQKDEKLAKDPEVRALAGRVQELVTCGAVRADSDAGCKMLADEGAVETCRRVTATFHELRAYPQGRSYMFDETKYQECKKIDVPGMASVCETLRKALRSGDPAQCVMNADFTAMCQQAVSAGNLPEVSDCAVGGPQIKNMWEGECRAMVTLDESKCDIPGPRQAEMAKQCRDDIAARKSFGKGLKELAASGSEAEKEYAKAALGDGEACKALAKSAVATCTAGEPAAAASPGPKDAGAKDGAAAPKAEAPAAAEAPAH